MRANISGASFPNELRNLLQRRLEDLENQLLKKVNELEEEKSQLYNETVAHRQRTDSTLNSLMNRISELEKGLHKTLFCSLVILLSQVQETRQCCNTFDFNVCNYLALCASKFDNIFPYFSVKCYSSPLGFLYSWSWLFALFFLMFDLKELGTSLLFSVEGVLRLFCGPSAYFCILPEMTQ